MFNFIKIEWYLLIARFYIRKSKKLEKSFREYQEIADSYLISAKRENDRAKHYIEKSKTIINSGKSLA